MALSRVLLFGLAGGLCGAASQSRGTEVQAYEGLSLQRDGDDPTMAWGLQWNPAWSGSAGSGKAVRQLVLVRHGQYHHNEDTAKNAEELNRLTPFGERQSYLTGRYLASLQQQAAVKAEKTRRIAEAKTAVKEASGGEMKKECEKRLAAAKAENDLCGSLLLSPTIRTMYVSTMIRAKQTAHLMRAGMADYAAEERAQGRVVPPLPPLEVDPTLGERYPCWVSPHSNGMGKSDILKEDVEAAEDVFHRYFYRPQLVAPSFRGSVTRWWSSVSGALFTSPRPRFPSVTQETEAVVDVAVAHSNMMRYHILRALQLPPEAWLRLCTPHCSLTILKFSENGKVSVTVYGSASHLPMEYFSHRNLH